MNQFDTQLAWRSAAERLLHDARRLTGRAALGRVAVVLHLSAITAARPHHRTVARALMQDTASWHEGQMFLLPDGDMAVLCRDTRDLAAPGAVGAAGAVPRVADPRALPGMLQRLLAVDAPPGAHLVSVWALPEQAAALIDYAARKAGSAPVSFSSWSTNPAFERGGSKLQGPIMSAATPSAGPACGVPVPQAVSAAVSEAGFAGQIGAADALGSLVGAAALGDLLQRQSAIALTAGNVGHAGLRPIYHEVSFSIAGLEARISPQAPVASDPFLFRHLASRLDPRMLEALVRELGSGGPLDVSRPGQAALHLNLTLPGVLSQAFERFAAAVVGKAGRVGVEISLIEAVSDCQGLARARVLLREHGFTLVLDGVSHLALLMTRPGLLGADLLKLDWSPRLPELPDSEQAAVDRALHDVDLARVVLHRAETEQAMRWGVAHGIRRFQGRHVDAMLGAARIVGCSFAEGCRLRQCIERACAASVVGRAGCHNQALLDNGAPESTDAMVAMSRAAWPSASEELA